MKLKCFFNFGGRILLIILLASIIHEGFHVLDFAYRGTSTDEVCFFGVKKDFPSARGWTIPDESMRMTYSPSDLGTVKYYGDPFEMRAYFVSGIFTVLGMVWALKKFGEDLDEDI